MRNANYEFQTDHIIEEFCFSSVEAPSVVWQISWFFEQGQNYHSDLISFDFIY